jgi:hypothetical protein
MRRLIPAITAVIALTTFANLAPRSALSAQTNKTGVAYPLRDALINYRKTPHSYIVNAINSDGHKITLAWQEGPGGVANFEGKAAVAYNSTYTTSVDGKPISVAKDVQYYAPGGVSLLGSVFTSTGKAGASEHYSVVTVDQPLPMSAHIGEGGPNGTMFGYSGPDKAHNLDKRQTFWSLQRDPANANDALYCERQVLQLAATKDVVQLSTECYHEDAAGNFTAPVEVQQSSTTFH